MGGVITATLYNILKKITKKENRNVFLLCSVFVLNFVFTLGLPNYNAMAIMWWLFAILIELKNTDPIEDTQKVKNNIKIGILLGIIAFTKQNIGFFACVATLCISALKKFFDSNEEFVKEMLAKICGVLMVVLAMLMYLIATNSFYSFVDYCVGGLFEFGSENVYLKFPINYLLVLFLVGVASICVYTKLSYI